MVVAEVAIRQVRPDERRNWDALMEEQHYLGFRQFAGRGLCKVAVWRVTGRFRRPLAANLLQ